MEVLDKVYSGTCSMVGGALVVGSGTYPTIISDITGGTKKEKQIVCVCVFEI